MHVNSRVEKKVIRAICNEVPQLVIDEGIYLVTYKDTLGYATSGVGCLITDQHPLHGCAEGTPVETPMILSDFFEELHTKVYSDLRRFTDEELSAMPLDVVQCLVNILFNMGSKLFRLFPSAVTAFRTQDWRRAALEMNYKNGLKPELGESLWCLQVHDRADRIIDRIERHIK